MECICEDAEHFAERVLMMEMIKELATEARDPLYHEARAKRALRMITAVADEMIDCLQEDALNWGVEPKQLRAAGAVGCVSFRSNPSEHGPMALILQRMGELPEPIAAQAVVP
jgi:hypothetical protein